MNLKVTKMKKLSLRIFFTLLLGFFLFSSEVVAAEKYTYLNMWPKVTADKYYLGLKDIVSVEDKFYIVDGTNVKVISNTGELLKTWKIKDADYLDVFLFITASKNYIYVTVNSVVQKYTLDGKLLAEWGSEVEQRNENEEIIDFIGICDITTDLQGNVYVLDNTDTIKMLNEEGKLIKEWEVADFSVGIAADIYNNVLVTNYADNTIVKYDNQGKLIASWNFDGEEAGNITTDFLGYIYVNDLTRQRIYKYDPYGHTLASWYNPCFTIARLVTDAKGFLYSIDTTYIQKYDSSGNLLEEWGSGGSLAGKFSVPMGIAVDSKENVFVLDLLNHRVQKFDSRGKFLNEWGILGSKSSEFSFPEDIALDKQGNIYVADSRNKRIQKFSNSGKFLSQWGKQGTGNGQFALPTDLDIDSKGNIYVIDSGNNNLQKFNPKGQFLKKWTNFGKGKQLIDPQGITIDSKDNVYVNNLNGVYKLSAQGKLLTFWSFQNRVKLRDEAMFRQLTNLTVDTKNNIYIADQIYDYIEKYSPQGKLLGKWGKTGLGNDEFQRISDLTISKSNKLYLIDDALSRVQVFKIP